MDIKELYNKASNNNKAAERELFKILDASFKLILQYKGMNSQDAEDVIQEAMIVIGEKLKSEEKIGYFAAWSHTVLKNKWLDHLKSRKYNKNKAQSELPDAYPAKKDSVDYDLIEQLINCFRKVCMNNRRQARILNLHFQGYSTEEICSRFGLTRSNMYSLLSRARSLLELCLDKGNKK